jgi:DNA-binding CsgD family transcriptional regulator
MIRVSRPTNRAPYEVLVTPLLQRATQPILLGAWAAVFVCDPAAEQTASLAALQRAYGLSAAEARLMQGLLAGETLGSIAEKRSVSKETIRSQIRSVFTKTGTSNQNQLLRLGLRSLAALL